VIITKKLLMLIMMMMTTMRTEAEDYNENEDNNTQGKHAEFRD